MGEDITFCGSEEEHILYIKHIISAEEDTDRRVNNHLWEFFFQ